MTTNDKPFAGVKILVTRAAHQAKDFSEKLSALGASVIEMPLVEFTPPDSWQALDQAIADLEQYHWIIFASSNAVRSFVGRLTTLRNSGEACFELAQLKSKIAVIGESTARVAQQFNLSVNFQPRSFIAEDFVDEFPNYPKLSGVRILWPRTNVGRSYIEEKLTDAGAAIEIVAAYKTCLPKDPDTLTKELHDLIKNKKIDAITLASTQTAINLASLIHDKSLLSSILVVSIGPETSNGAKKHLGKVDLEASPHTTDGMIEALKTHFARCHN